MDVILRIFTEKGETEKLIAAEKVNIYQGAVRIDRVSAEYISEYFTGKQMIRYKVNANGEINALYKYNDVSAEDFGCDGFVRNIVSTGRCYYHTKGYIYDQYNAKEKSAMLDENAVIFNFGFSDDGEEGWTVVKASEIKTSKYFERMEVFDLTEFGGALCVLVYETELQIFAATDPIMLVEKSYLSLNEDDETELTLSGISHVKGAELTVKAVDTGLISNATAVAVEKNIPISSVKAGDVIQCNLNAENEIISWRLLNRAQDDEERAYYMSATAETITGTEVSGLGFYGRICSSNDKYFTIDNEYLPKKRAYKFIDTDNQVVLRFYKKSVTVERIEKGDIYNGMTAFIYAQPESGYVFIVEYRR